jgi:hypothetical protein
MDDVAINEKGFWDGANVHKHHAHNESLAKWIANYLITDKDKPVYDLGCGLGFYLKELEKSGFTNLTGYEGSIPHHGKFFDNILQHDITLPLHNLPPGNVICLEVGEHIPGHHQYYFLENLKNLCNNKLVLSWAVRGQPGHGHFHCLDNHEVIACLSDKFLYLEQPSIDARKVIIPPITPWFVNTIMVFKKKKALTFF